MNNKIQPFNSFCTSFEKGDITAAISSLNDSFKANAKITLQKLYKRNFFSNNDFLKIASRIIDIPDAYKLLFEIIKRNYADVSLAEKFITNFSKGQLLQGVANILEKNNTMLKYNEKWNVKFANGDAQYLETERQGMYFSKAGIEFQELLKLLFKYFQHHTNNGKKVGTWCKSNLEYIK